MKRLTERHVGPFNERKMVAAGLVHWNTFPSLLNCSMYSGSFATKSCFDGNGPRRRTVAGRRLRSTSTRLSHDEWVGMEWKTTCRCVGLACHFCTSFERWVMTLSRMTWISPLG